MESESFPYTIMEQREEMMVSPTGGIPILRQGCFLKPTVPDGPRLKLPSLSPIPKWSLNVEFIGWREPMRKWEKWVDRMCLRYSSSWKKTGIYNAIMCSKYTIHQDVELVFCLAERWCSDTNTFVFPWGEASITLEDMLVLGGFSVLGGPVLMPLDTMELRETENSLNKSLLDLGRTKETIHCEWLNLHMGSGSKIEHEAFLSLWLSRFVFPADQDKIDSNVFPIAVHLANGNQIALAPAVLASIYKDLSLLKEAMSSVVTKRNDVRKRNDDGKRGDDDDYESFLAVWAPLYFVQVWAWERLLQFQPKPKYISSGEPRMARWHGVRKSDIGNIRPMIDSSGDVFVWRPYVRAVDDWSLPEFYKEREQMASGEGLDNDLESFARCKRACNLVGIDCLVPYNPHRVAMQFGFDQDLPGWIPSSCDPGMSWYNYSKPFHPGEISYLPSRLSEPDVTLRYLDWWRRTVLCPVDSVKGMVKRRRSSRMLVRLTKHAELQNCGNESDVLPGFTLKRPKIEINGCNEISGDGPGPLLAASPQVTTDKEPASRIKQEPMEFAEVRPEKSLNESLKELILRKTVDDPDVPPGFQPHSKGVKGKSQPPITMGETSRQLHTNVKAASSKPFLAAHSKSPMQAGVGTLQAERNNSLDALLEKCRRLCRTEKRSDGNPSPCTNSLNLSSPVAGLDPQLRMRSAIKQEQDVLEKEVALVRPVAEAKTSGRCSVTEVGSTSRGNPLLKTGDGMQTRGEPKDVRSKTHVKSRQGKSGLSIQNVVSTIEAEGSRESSSQCEQAEDLSFEVRMKKIASELAEMKSRRDASARMMKP